jgi:hypothetical protein
MSNVSLENRGKFVDQAQQTKMLDEITWRTILNHQVASDFERHSHRRWRRYPANGEVKAEFAVDGQPRKRTWDILQIAAGGLTVRAGEEIDQDTPVKLQINLDGNPVIARGVTRHCTQTGGGYKLGIKLIFGQENQTPGSA